MLFQQIIGQKKLKSQLIKSVQAGRISHAQLFLGPLGSGNLALAIAYAQYLNCENPQAQDSCGKCNSCLKYEKFIHPDLHFTFPIISRKTGEKTLSSMFLKEWRIALSKNPYLTYQDWMNEIEAQNKQGNISVAECQDIINRLSLMAFEAKYKVLIIWLPEFLKEAGNVLLKIIEEPPQKTIFLLVAHHSDQLLSTITSRTQLIKIPRIQNSEIAFALNEKFDLSEAQANNIALMSNGNWNIAQDYLTQKTNLNEALFVAWMRIAYQKNGLELMKWLEKIAPLGREKQKAFLTYALFLIRECFLMQFGSANLLRLKGSEMDFIEKFSPFIHEKNVAHLTKSLNNAIYYLERNGNPKLIFHQLSIEFEKYLNQKLPAQIAY